MQALMPFGGGHITANPHPHPNPPPRQRIEADLHQRQHELLEAGGKLNEWNNWLGETAFTDGLDCVYGEDTDLNNPTLDAQLLAARLGCLCGAELHYPSNLECESYLWACGPGFVSAVFAADTLVLAMLLLHGGDPNWSNKRDFPWPASHPFSDSLMSEAMLHYEEIVFGINEPPPEPDWRVHYELAKGSSLMWIDYLDQVAVKHSHRRPDHLYLLHAFGAREREEFKALTAVDPFWRPPLPQEAMRQAIAWCSQRGDADGLRKLEKVTALCRIELAMPKKMLPQGSAKRKANAMLTSAEVLNRPGWSWPLINRLLKMHDRSTYWTATGKTVKSYLARRVERAEALVEFQTAVARRRRTSPRA